MSSLTERSSGAEKRDGMICRKVRSNIYIMLLYRRTSLDVFLKKLIIFLGDEGYGWWVYHGTHGLNPRAIASIEIIKLLNTSSPYKPGDKSPELIGSFFVLKVITLLSLPVFGVMIYETWHPCYSDDTQPPGLSCRIFGAHLPFSINRINLHILSAQRCALYSSPKSSYSGVLPICYLASKRFDLARRGFQIP